MIDLFRNVWWVLSGHYGLMVVDRNDLIGLAVTVALSAGLSGYLLRRVNRRPIV